MVVTGGLHVHLLSGYACNTIYACTCINACIVFTWIIIMFDCLCGDY